jgi:hypothetical protein
MKYVCLGYIEPGKLESTTEAELNADLTPLIRASEKRRSKTKG